MFQGQSQQKVHKTPSLPKKLGVVAHTFIQLCGKALIRELQFKPAQV
jgi:hypothetical protein